MKSLRNANKRQTTKSGNLSRRDLLQRAGWTVAAAAIPAGVFAADAAISPVMAKLSTYMSEAGATRPTG